MSRLAVDWTRCDAHGLCAELLPEAIALDEWGYPVLAEADLPVRLEGLARRAVRDCPTLALRLLDGPPPGASAAGTRTPTAGRAADRRDVTTAARPRRAR